MLDAQAVVAGRDAAERGLVGVEHDAVAAVADRVRANLEARSQGALAQMLHVGLRRAQQPGVRRVVAVRREQRGAARAERAVDVELDRANRQPAVVHVHEDDLHIPGTRQLLVRFDDVLANARIADRGQPPAVTFLQRRFGGAHELLVRRRRDRVRDQGHRVVDEDAGRRAVLVAQDAPAGGIRGGLCDARELHRLRVREQRMPVDAVQHHRPVRQRSAQRAVRGKGLAGPEVLVPAVADDPRIARARRERRRAPHDLLERRDVREVDLVQRHPDRREVEVRVDQPRQHRDVAEIERLGARTAQRPRAFARADVDEPPVPHRERLRPRSARIYGVDRGRGDDQVRRTLTCSGGDAGRGGRRRQPGQNRGTAHDRAVRRSGARPRRLYLRPLRSARDRAERPLLDSRPPARRGRGRPEAGGSPAPLTAPIAQAGLRAYARRDQVGERVAR